jgi:2-aminoadipate transaminase
VKETLPVERWLTRPALALWREDPRPWWSAGDDGPPPIYLVGGMPDPGSLPRADLVEAARTVLLGPAGAEALNYGPVGGYPGLVAIVQRLLARRHGVEAGPENILITAGASQAIALVCQAVVEPGDVVIVEGPTFAGSLRTIQAFGPEIVTVPVDEEGLVTAALAETLARLARAGRRVKLLYTIPTFQNPTGATLSLARRQELLDLAARYQVLILEDDAYYELRFEGEPLPPLYALDRSGLVVRVNTLSKILAAGVRLGWITAAPPLLRAFRLLKLDGGTSPFASHIAAAYLERHLETHLEDLIAVYRQKRDALLGALATEVGDRATWSRPAGGFFVWLRLPPSVDGQTLLRLARAEGVAYLPGPLCFPDGRGWEFVRFAFSYETPERLVEGVRRFGRALRRALGEPVYTTPSVRSRSTS